MTPTSDSDTKDTWSPALEASWMEAESTTVTQPVPGPGPESAPTNELGPALPSGEGPGENWLVIGKGGLGRVLQAWDPQLGRGVALKEMTRGDAAATVRFLREARVTARLEHPSIVPVYSLGQHADGRPYYTMRHVRGRTFGAALAACDGLDERLGLMDRFADLCHALAYAHSRGVVHRDVKPDNIILGDFGETVLLDWGIARVLGQDDHSTATEEPDTPMDRTMVGTMLGTPAWMSPEQAAGQVDLVDARTDAWALGVILYELLAGRRPFEGKSTDEVLARVRQGPPPLLARISPQAPPELVAIAERALRPERAHRYPDAGALARDVDAWQAGALVHAYRYTTWDHLRRLGARYRQALMVGGLAALVLAGVGFVSVQRVRSERDRALVAEQHAVTSRNDALTHLAGALDVRAVAAWKAEEVPEAWLYAARSLVASPSAEALGIVLGAAAWPSPRVEGAVRVPIPCATLRVDPSNAVPWCSAAGELARWQDGPVQRLPLPAGTSVMAVGPGVHKALVTDGETWSVVDLEGGPAVTLDLSDGSINAIFSRDGRRAYIATGSSDIGGPLVSFDTATGTRLGAAPRITSRGMAISPDGRLLAVVSRQGVELLDPVSLARRTDIDLNNSSGWNPVFSPDGRRLALAGSDGSTQIIQLFGGAAVHTPGTGGPGMVSWSPDGELLAHACEDGTVRIIRTTDGRVLAQLPQPATSIYATRFLPSGDLLVGSAAGLVAWDLSELPHARHLLVDSDAGINAVVFDSGRRVLTNFGQGPGPVRIWDARTGAMLHELSPAASGGEISLDGRTAALVEDGDLVVLDAQTGQERARVADCCTIRPGFLADDTLAAVDRDGGVSTWTPDLAPVGRTPLPIPALPWYIPERTRLLLVGQYALLAAKPGAARFAPLIDTSGPLLSFSASPNRRMLALGYQDGQVAIASTDADAVELQWQASDIRVRRAAVSDDGRLFAAETGQGELRLWDSTHAPPRLRAVLHADLGRVLGLAFSEDGHTLYSGSHRGGIRAWDTTRIGRAPGDLLADVEARFGVSIVAGRVVAGDLPVIDLPTPRHEAP